MDFLGVATKEEQKLLFEFIILIVKVIVLRSLDQKLGIPLTIELRRN